MQNTKVIIKIIEFLSKQKFKQALQLLQEKEKQEMITWKNNLDELENYKSLSSTERIMMGSADIEDAIMVLIKDIAQEAIREEPATRKHILMLRQIEANHNIEFFLKHSKIN